MYSPAARSALPTIRWAVKVLAGFVEPCVPVGHYWNIVTYARESKGPARPMAQFEYTLPVHEHVAQWAPSPPVKLVLFANKAIFP